MRARRNRKIDKIVGFENLRTREGKSPKIGVWGMRSIPHTPIFGIFFNELLVVDFLPSNPFRFFDGMLAASIAGIDRASRLDHQDVALLFGDGFVFHTFGHHQHLPFF